MKKQIVGFGIAMAALVAVAGTQQAQAATSANTTVNLSIQDYASVSTSTPDITVTPTLAQIAAGSVTTTDAPITLNIESTNGSTVTVEGDGVGTLDDAHLSLNAGAGWVLASTGGTLFSSTATQVATTDVPVNVKITNLSAYEVGSYSNTVTFTIVASE